MGTGAPKSLGEEEAGALDSWVPGVKGAEAGTSSGPGERKELEDWMPRFWGRRDCGSHARFLPESQSLC